MTVGSRQNVRRLHHSFGCNNDGCKVSLCASTKCRVWRFATTHSSQDHDLAIAMVLHGATCRNPQCQLPDYVDRRARALLVGMLQDFRRGLVKLRTILSPNTIRVRETSSRKRVTIAKVDDAIARIRDNKPVDASQIGQWKAYLVELVQAHRRLVDVLRRGDYEVFKKKNFLHTISSKQFFERTMPALDQLERDLAHDEAVVQQML